MRAFLVFLLGLAGSTAVAGETKKDVQGSVDYVIRGDSIVFDCQAVVKGFKPERVYFELYAGSEKWPFVYLVPEDSASKHGIHVFVQYDSASCTTKARTRITLPRNNRGIPAEAELNTIPIDPVYPFRWQKVRYVDAVWSGLLLAPTWGLAYYDANLGSGFHRTGYAASFEYGLAGNYDRYKFSFLTNPIHNLSKLHRFTFGPDVVFSISRYANASRLWCPAYTIGVVQNLLQIREDSVEIKRSRWGGIFGGSVEGPFERFYYRYSTPQGGYHSLGVDLAFKRTGHSSMGTTYEFVKGIGYSCFRMEFYFDFSYIGDGDAETLDRPNNRPFWHKVLARGALLPFLPFYGFSKLAH